MKLFITPSYTFTPGASGVGTVNLSGISGFDIKYLVAIINQTRGIVIYATGDTATRYTNVAGTTVTLNYDTSAQSGADVLQVIYEVTSVNPLTDAQLRATAVPVSGTFFQATQPVSAASLPLPSGAATATNQTTGNTSLSNIDGKLPALVSSRVPVDGSGVTQPVSGTFWQATQPVSIASSVPVTGPLTDAQLRASTVPISGTVTANTGLSQPLTDAQLRASAVPVSGTVTANTGLTQPLTDTQLRAAAVPVSGTFFQATQPVSGTVTANTGLSQPLTDAELRASAVPVSVGSIALPTGASTSALQTTGNSSLSSIDGKINSLGQKTMANSMPVTIASDQSAIPITGSITASNPSVYTNGANVLSPTGNVTFVGGWDGTNLRGLSTNGSGALNVLGPMSLADFQSTFVSSRLPVDGSGVTQPVSGTFWQATQPVSIASSVPVTGTFFQATQPVSAAALPLPSGASTETTLAAVEVDTSAIASSTSAIDGKTPALSTRVLDNEASGSPVRAIGQEIWNVSFSQVGASVISDQFVTPQTGTGVSYSQASGALAIVAGTTANAEFFTRSTTTWRGAMRLKFSIVSSQRIANTNLAVMLADLVGEGLTVTINSATSITVAQAGHAFTSTSVGQFVQVGRIVGAAGVPGRYAIASVVAGTSYNLTVAGWPASGSCTATIFGHSYVRNLVTGTTATAINVDAQRRGWAQGDTAATINTTASPGTIITCELTGREVFWADQVRASTTTPTVAVRANRVENIPDDNLNLYLFVWSFNGTTAPASSTTWTMSFCSIEKFANMPVYIQGNRAQGAMNPLPVTQSGTVTVSGTVTSNIGTGTLTAANLNFPGIIADVASAALTTTTTTSAFTPTFGICYSVNIVVTAVSGSFATMDVAIEESDDSGTNWFKVYDFPRITLNGQYRSPIMRLTGNRVRYVQTVGGGSPSFTRSINRLQSSTNNEAVRQLINRTISLTTLNSTTPSLDTRDCGNRAQLVINVGAITTTAPAIQLEGSDDNGASWYSIGAPLTAVDSSTVQQTVVDINAALMRARVSTAGVGVTAGYVMIKAHD